MTTSSYAIPTLPCHSSNTFPTILNLSIFNSHRTSLDFLNNPSPSFSFNSNVSTYSEVLLWFVIISALRIWRTFSCPIPTFLVSISPLHGDSADLNGNWSIQTVRIRSALVCYFNILSGVIQNISRTLTNESRECVLGSHLCIKHTDCITFRNGNFLHSFKLSSFCRERQDREIPHHLLLLPLFYLYCLSLHLLA